DGMGNVINTSSSDPFSADLVNSTYTGSGQVHSVTNPYYSGSTNSLSYTYYDLQGRPVASINQDSSARLWCYNGIAPTNLPSGVTAYCSSPAAGSTGTWVDITDENGNHWQQISDSFGRLTTVMEPNGSAKTASRETDYFFDGLRIL